MLFLTLVLTWLSIGTYKYITDPEPKIKHKKVDGCRWIKFPGEHWQHSPSCDSHCHL